MRRLSWQRHSDTNAGSGSGPASRGEGRVFGRRGVSPVLVVLLAALTLGATTDTGRRFNDLGHRLMCTCGCSQVLLECNHVGCQTSEKMRAELTAALNRGESDDRILSGFVAEYGPVVLAAPTKTGFDRLAWLTPYVVLGLGLLATAAVVRLWKSRPTAAPRAVASPATPEVLETLRQRVHEETEI